MKQVTQRLRDGQIEVLDVPRPVLTHDGLIVDVRASLVSAGTERSTVEAARQSLLGKARARPEQARQVVEKARTDGVRATLDAVRTRLGQPSALGYSSAGVVLEVGERVPDLRPGDRVACAGAGYAVHAELNYVPANLAVALPDNVGFEAGAFATVGSIALHAVRQADAKLGERVAVVGLGLVGQLTCRLLTAAGCQVVGIDIAIELVERARSSGIAAGYARTSIDPSDPPSAARDCDAIIVTASTESDDPVRLAGSLARDRARVVVVGAVGMNLPRTSYYGKELEVRVSRSYGPGRYDREYEERGLDYPIGYVRWTERRNMSAFVELLRTGRMSVDDLITAQVPVEQAADAYERLLSTSTSPLGLILTYATGPERPVRATVPRSGARPGVGSAESPATIGVIGTGSFSQRVLIPGLQQAGFQLDLTASANGLSATAAAERFGFRRAATPDEILDSNEVDAVAIGTRHGSHAEYAIRALEGGKAVFVEKPPALSLEELDRLRDAARGRVLQVGFNRRFAPMAIAMRKHIVSGDRPIELLYRVAAARLDDDHWLNDPDDGGGRLIGEGCHFVDFACWFMQDLPRHVQATIPETEGQLIAAQRFVITLAFAGGSIATVVYGSESAPGVAKELVEAHSSGRSGKLDDYRKLELRGGGRRSTTRHRTSDKGHRSQFEAFRSGLDGTSQSTPSALDTMAVTFDALKSAHTLSMLRL
jgi:predicted dehydrogenase/threonine dehydrogenase-like Zn-dependent dehydrogenase